MLGNVIKEGVREHVFYKQELSVTFAQGFEYLDPKVTLSINALLMEDLEAARKWLKDNPSFIRIQKGFDPSISKLIEIESDDEHRYDVATITIDNFGVCVHISPKGCNIHGETEDILWEDIYKAWLNHVNSILEGTPIEHLWLNKVTKEKLACGAKFTSLMEVPETYQELAESLGIDLINYSYGFDVYADCFKELINHNLNPGVVEELYHEAQAYMPPDGDFSGEDAAKEVYHMVE